jgi:hypothetical protein
LINPVSHKVSSKPQLETPLSSVGLWSESSQSVQRKTKKSWTIEKREREKGRQKKDAN